jgi:hypothetical protein
MPIFVYRDEAFYLTNKQCLSLELILNLSDEYKQFVRLGDKLYESFIERKEYHNIDADEYNWLKNNIHYL